MEQALGAATRRHDANRRGFASDNEAGAHPEILAALAAANGGHQPSYGADEYTARLQDVVAAHFGAGAAAFPVLNGTAANVLALQAVLPRWGGVLCAATSHVATDESTAPETVGGFKTLGVPAPAGKLTPALVERADWGRGDEHRAQPLALSLTQATELGTVYTAAEIRALADWAHDRGIAVHLDGARLANAAAYLGCGLAEFTTEAGVDLISLGGTKNGLLFGEAVVLPRPHEQRAAAAALPYLRKLDLQLASKMRFVSAQLVALLADDLWLRSARQANAMAARLAAGLSTVDGVRITQPVQSNAVFAILDPGVAGRLRESFRFHDWDPTRGEVRWMCAFDTTGEDVDAFLAELRRLLSDAPG